MDQQNTPPSGLITQEQKDTFLAELGLEDLDEDRKEMLMQSMIDTLLNRIFTRITPSLTKADFATLDDLEMRPDAEQWINNYLVSKIPNLDQIVAEEIASFREEMKKSVADIKALLPQA